MPFVLFLVTVLDGELDVGLARGASAWVPRVNAESEDPSTAKGRVISYRLPLSGARVISGASRGRVRALPRDDPRARVASLGAAHSPYLP